MTDVPENIVIGACNLLDTIKSEWGDQWSEWDQSIRDGLSKALSPAPASKGPTEADVERVAKVVQDAFITSWSHALRVARAAISAMTDGGK